MIEQDYLYEVKTIAIRTETSQDSIHTEGGDYREHELEAAIDTPERNRRMGEAYRQHACGRRAICFAVTVQHATLLTPSRPLAFLPLSSAGKRPSLNASGFTRRSVMGRSRCSRTCKCCVRALMSLSSIAR